MEHLSSLIHKLKEQFEQKVPAARMLDTLRQIESHLVENNSPVKNEFNQLKNSGKVAVMMPAGRYGVEKNSENSQSAKDPVNKSEEKNGNGQARKKEHSGWLFDPMQEIPTLTHQQIAEINDVIGSNGASLNDHLREEKTEVAHTLTEVPIRDLKKGIGVNDRFVFLNDLFRGDEDMYERSLKTINGFRILPEAEYWINRELKIKLGWIDDQPAVRHFYQLVRRRFS